MKIVRINPEILAQRLESYAEWADGVALRNEREFPDIAVTIRRQAAESREWAEAVRQFNENSVSIDPDGNLMFFTV